MDEKYFIPVTPSHENCHTEKNESESNQKQNIPKELVGDILKIIGDEHGQIALNYVLQSACQKSSIIKEFLKNNDNELFLFLKISSVTLLKIDKKMLDTSTQRIDCKMYEH